jgi:GAF domain-containing protein
MDDLVRLVIAETAEALATDVCSLYLIDPDDGRLVLAATNGISQKGVGRVRLALGEGVTGWAAEDHRPAIVPDMRAEPRLRCDAIARPAGSGAALYDLEGDRLARAGAGDLPDCHRGVQRGWWSSAPAAW